jgi:hypothetical protein
MWPECGIKYKMIYISMKLLLFEINIYLIHLSFKSNYITFYIYFKYIIYSLFSFFIIANYHLDYSYLN